MTVSLAQSGGTLYTGSAAVSFNSPCVAAGTAQIRVNGNPISSVTTTTGLATVTYVASGCAGADVVTASASGTVTVAAATVGSIEYVSATPTNIALEGTGDTHSNGNGAFDNGEAFTDLPEPFRDDDENGVYDLGEDFFAFNSNQTRDGGNPIFNGVLCHDTTGRCGGSSTRSTGIGEQNLVLLSGSQAFISQGDGSALPATIAMGGTDTNASLGVWVRDLHDNPMPGGTTVTVSVSGASLSILDPGSYKVPCSAIPAGTQFPRITLFPFTIHSGSQTGSGAATVTVLTPKGVKTTQQIPVTVP